MTRASPRRVRAVAGALLELARGYGRDEMALIFTTDMGRA